MKSSALNSNDCWAVYDKGKVGTGNQCRGLAKILGYDPKVIEISTVAPWRYLPPQLWFQALKGVVDENGHTLKAPWPKMIIAAGRASVAPTAAIRKLTGGSTKVIQLQDPKINPNHFDAVVAPAHDLTSGDNVIVTKGALHHLSRAHLDEAAQHWQAIVGGNRPYVSLIIGGTSKRHRLNPDIIQQMADEILPAVEAIGGSLLIAVSRRTESHNREAIQSCFSDKAAYIWTGEGENPYMGLLGLADYLIVTSDSVSMTSEACFTGKPVYSYHLPGGGKVFKRFHTLFEKEGYTRPFQGKLETWHYEPLDEFGMTTQKLKKILTNCK
ncbi:MAG: mitochondrial fission ELM1 family protein [Alphaproteobacteria bacterium]